MMFVGTTLTYETLKKIDELNMPDCLTRAAKIRKLVLYGLKYNDSKQKYNDGF